MAWVQVLNETPSESYDGWRLFFQKCVYHYDDGKIENGYRFIWRRPNGNLQAARGQARLPDKNVIESLLQQAKNEKWY